MIKSVVKNRPDQFIGRAFLFMALFEIHIHADTDSINKKLDIIMANQSQHAQELRDLKAQNEKAREEVLAKVAALEQAIADAGNTTPEVDEAMADLKASIQADDDLNPDATVGGTEG